MGSCKSSNNNYNDDLQMEEQMISKGSITNHESKSLQKEVYYNGYKICINLNKSILTIDITEIVTQTNWKQQFRQTSFKNNDIFHIANSLMNATKPIDIQKRCKIISNKNWCYFTIDNEAEFPTFELPKQLQPQQPSSPMMPLHPTDSTQTNIIHECKQKESQTNYYPVNDGIDTESDLKQIGEHNSNNKYDSSVSQLDTINLNTKNVHEYNEKILYECQQILERLKRDEVKISLCTGHCGSEFGEFTTMIESCTDGSIYQMDNYHVVLKDLLSNKSARLCLVEWMKQVQYDTYYNGIYNDLNDVDNNIENKEQLEQIGNIINKFVKDAYLNILQDIANKSCKIPERGLVEEIMQNNNWESLIVRKCDKHVTTNYRQCTSNERTQTHRDRQEDPESISNIESTKEKQTSIVDGSVAKTDYRKNRKKKKKKKQILLQTEVSYTKHKQQQNTQRECGRGRKYNDNGYNGRKDPMKNNQNGQDENKQNNDDRNYNNNNNNDDPDDSKKSAKEHESADMLYFLQRLLQLKQHENYLIMKAKGYELSDNELLAVICYCDSSSSCFRMKQYHRGLEKQCKWGNMYYHLTNAVDKLHQCFHLRNALREEYKTLFHGSRCNQLDVFSKGQLFLKTITSFTYEIAVATEFAQNTINGDGMILVIDQAGKAIYSGRLRAADVTWISIHNEKEYIVLPTTFQSFKELNEQHVTKKGWNVNVDKNKMYITKRYISNKDALCISSDNILESMKPKYNDMASDIDVISNKSMTDVYTLHSMASLPSLPSTKCGEFDWNNWIKDKSFMTDLDSL